MLPLASPRDIRAVGVSLSFPVVLLSACAGGSALSTVSGTVAYRERIAMPPGAVVEVSLEDVSRADAQATVVGNVLIEDPGNVPVAFEIPYDPNDIDESGSYSVRARILVDGQPRWVSATANPVLTRGNDEHVEIMLTAEDPPEGAAGAAPSGAPSALAGTRWKLTHLGDEEVVVADPQREPHMIFDEAASRVGGYGGCNQFGGNYRIDGSTIEIRDVVSTMMACIDGMETETGFHAAVESARTWRIEGTRLELSDAAGVPLARFEVTNPE